MGLSCTKQTSCFPGSLRSGGFRRGRKGKAAACSSAQSMNPLACPTKFLLHLCSAMCLHGNIVRTRPVSKTWGKYSTYKILKGSYSSHRQQCQHAPLGFRPDVHGAFCGEGLLPDSGGQMCIRALWCGLFST